MVPLSPPGLGSLSSVFDHTVVQWRQRRAVVDSAADAWLVPFLGRCSSIPAVLSSLPMDAVLHLLVRSAAIVADKTSRLDRSVSPPPPPPAAAAEAAMVVADPSSPLSPPPPPPPLEVVATAPGERFAHAGRALETPSPRGDEASRNKC